jgi:hypothetical protein
MTLELHSAPSTVAALIDGLIEPPLGWMDLCINGCTQSAANAAATAAAAGASEILKSWPKINLDAAGFVAFGAMHAKCCRPDTPVRALKEACEEDIEMRRARYGERHAGCLRLGNTLDVLLERVAYSLLLRRLTSLMLTRRVSAESAANLFEWRTRTQTQHIGRLNFVQHEF